MPTGKPSVNQLFEFARSLNIGLTAGYIGNLERWGDDRCYKIWSGTTCLWSCEARECTRRDVSEGYRAVKLFALGYSAGLATSRKADAACSEPPPPIDRQAILSAIAAARLTYPEAVADKALAAARDGGTEAGLAEVRRAAEFERREHAARAIR